MAQNLFIFYLRYAKKTYFLNDYEVIFEKFLECDRGTEKNAFFEVCFKGIPVIGLLKDKTKSNNEIAIKICITESKKTHNPSRIFW